MNISGEEGDSRVQSIFFPLGEVGRGWVSPESRDQNPESRVQSPDSKVQGPVQLLGYAMISITISGIPK